MGLQQSKEELLYQQVNYGNVDGIRALRAQGAGLEWIDKEGKTPLMVACLRPDLLNVAKVLIELGANVNAYRPGSYFGTALHHGAKKGLEQTVHLLLSHGANPFITNDDCYTPLELARERGHVNVVRAIEVLNSQQVQPGNAPVPNPLPTNSSLAPSVSSAPSKEDVDLAMAINASIQSAIAEGVPNVQPSVSTTNTNGWGNSPNNSLNGWGPPEAPAPSKMSGKARVDAPSSGTYNGWDVPGTSSNQSSSKPDKTQTNPPIVIPQEALPALPTPTAPPFAEETFYNGPIQYPSIDSTPVDVTMPIVAATTEGGSTSATSEKPGEDEKIASDSGNTPSGTCVICLDAPVEAACIPCGHMAGCMSCLKDIESKKWGCPICRATINQVIRLYAV
ncbi:hypothetical protein PR202_ga25464 [Eleusine coracana subsp. coracana]|uniref:RING-type domain-containing protein n=1 Tax=Eleusine coracana subsp. coracana TaxID=191504 RepID=A0AAV5DB33_ELECO|nr:hypothetical protein PR202_ga25404 [Eleusine coracana subsp. coracana]GJN07621.1 hypothetical protein PR202_ga25464 [Eleusine coracana subsp. coracana]